MNAAPAKESAKRLEALRERRGIKTLKQFWERLRKEAGYDGSYEAVRNYHFDREPSVKYLAAVAKVFGSDLYWLATGEPAADTAAITYTFGLSVLESGVDVSREVERGSEEQKRLREQKVTATTAELGLSREAVETAGLARWRDELYAVLRRASDGTAALRHIGLHESELLRWVRGVIHAHQTGGGDPSSPWTFFRSPEELSRRELEEALSHLLSLIRLFYSPDLESGTEYSGGTKAPDREPGH